MPSLSIQDFARTRGKSRTAIYKAIREGRVREAVGRNDNGKFVLDAELADLELSRNTEPAMVRDPEAIRAGIEANKDPTAGPLFREEVPAPEPESESKRPPVDEKTAKSLLSSRSAQALYDARLRRLDYEERVGSLVGIDVIKVELFRANRMIRDALLAVKGRLAPLLVGEQSEEKIRAAIGKEIDSVLQALTAEFTRKE